MAFACAKVVLGVPLIVDAMAGEREGRRLGGLFNTYAAEFTIRTELP